jgi:zinc protease
MRTTRSPVWLALAVLLVLALPGAPQTAAAVFDARTFTLNNGLQVVVVPNHRAPVVTQMIWYRVGAADEPAGKSGIAHFLEHLMFKGTPTMPPGAFSREVARVGGNENAFTGADYTSYFQSVAVEHLEMIMRLEADRMANLVLTDEIVLPERDVIIEERSQRIDNDPQSQLFEMVRAALFLHHPYRLPTIGWEHEMRGLTTADAIDFYRRWYAPNNAYLVIAGDVTVEQVKALAEKYYGPLPRRSVPERERLGEPAQFAPRTVTLTSPRVQLASWSRLYQAPSYRMDRQSGYALDVLSEIIGSGTTSRLYRSLVVDQGVATSVGAYYSGDAWDLGTFGVYGSPQEGEEPTALQAAIDKALADLLAEGITAEELASAKVRLQADAIKARDSLSGPARVFGIALTTGSTVADVEAWSDSIGEVTLEQVNAAARAVLRLDHSATGILLPEPVT